MLYNVAMTHLKFMRWNRAEYDLTKFLSDCEEVCATEKKPCDIVIKVAPLLQRLILTDTSLQQEHLKPDKKKYARHQVFCKEDESLSLFTMVWSPGSGHLFMIMLPGGAGIVEGILESMPC